MAKKKQRNQDVVFRRIRGRIVPIKRRKGTGRKSRERRNQAISGAALFGGATAVSGASGAIAGKLLKQATRIGQSAIDMTESAKKAFDFNHGGTPEGAKASAILQRGAMRRSQQMQKKLKLSKRSLKFGTNVFAGVIAGEGLERLGSAALGRDLNLGEEVAANVGGVVTSQAAVRGLKKGFETNFGRKAIIKILSRGRL